MDIHATPTGQSLEEMLADLDAINEALVRTKPELEQLKQTVAVQAATLEAKLADCYVKPKTYNHSIQVRDMSGNYPEPKKYNMIADGQEETFHRLKADLDAVYAPVTALQDRRHRLMFHQQQLALWIEGVRAKQRRVLGHHHDMQMLTRA